ncbi:S8 family serine peptidase [Thalassotalea nanhaiensis]|uniref:S8 family serine peptidase n=1 Tax=Thalassotalea nanhaiensis TaxID=3065648 RepID=A0ABY9TJQ9_9GAMM|nr:S8 family serine peptidase [Colwelliaceae bacterium SQ345]
MKPFKTLLTLLSGSIFAFSANAASLNDGQQIHQPIVGKEKIKYSRSHKARQDSLYYIQLHEQPLAAYDGNIKGLTATSITASKGSNTDQSGILNVKSTSSKNYLSYLSQKQNQIISLANKTLKRTIKVRHNYKVIVNALAAEITAEEAKVLAKQPTVKSVEKVGMHYIQTDSGPEFIKAKNIWDGVSDYAGTKGEGVVVGIIDTGINAYHPSFADIGGDGYDHTNPLGTGNYLPGDCTLFPQFCNDKLIGIVSYPEIRDNRPEVVNENYEELDDKLKVGYDFNAHGSHVSSTVAGNILNDVPYYLSVVDDIGSIVQESEFQFPQVSGVAPHANIVSYQVCNDEGCYSELTLLAVEHAIENGVNVLNYSVGGGYRDPWTSIDTLAFLNAREAGIHVATSAGNSGPDAQTIGAPGNAPWITTVAAYTHDRAFSEKALTAFSGGETTPADISGLGATKAYTGTVVLAKDFGDAMCLEPFEEDTFNGEIVVCQRGEIARVRKGLNVQLGGAGGLILANIEGETAGINADNHVLPAIHINAANGKVLTDWMATGSDHQLTITGSELISDESLGDIAAYFSSRGPNLPYANIFAPDVAGPGVDIYAANSEDHPFTEDVTEVPFTTMSGTSMSSPHVAGAMALIYAVHPDWTPAQVQSALMTTAQHNTRKDDDFDGETERSNFFDQGAGSIRVDAAVTAGLLLDISKAEYIEANPQTGGDPTSLNSSSMVGEKCISVCTWSRTVTATADATWTATYEYINPGVDLTISPASFTLAAGESQEITITAAANIELVDEWTHSFVKLTPSNREISASRLQVLANFVAGTTDELVEAKINNVHNIVTISDVQTTGSNDLQVRGFGLFKTRQYTGQAAGAGEDKEIFRNLDTIFAKQIVIPAYTKRIVVDIISSTSPDMDLFVGLDEDNDGVPNFYELYYSTLCLSGNVDSVEHCYIENPPAGTYWVFAHNFEGTAVGTMDDVTIEIGVVNYTEEPSFTIEAPVTVAQDELFDINLIIQNAVVNNALDDIQPGEKYYGLVQIGTTLELKRNVGETLISLTAIENEAVLSAALEQAVAGAELDYAIELPANSTSSDKSYEVSVTLPEGFTLVSSTSDAVVTGNLIEFTVIQPANGEISTIDFVIATTQINAAGDYLLTAQYSVNGVGSVVLNSAPITIEMPVQALINDNEALSLSINEGTAAVTLSALNSVKSVETDVLTYTWVQTSGTALALSALDSAEVSFATPTDLIASGSYSYEVTVSNGRSSDTATVTINIANVEPEKKSSGGGSTGILFILIGVFATVLRRR